MARKPTARPMGELLAVVARIMRNVEADQKLPRERSKRLRESLSKIMQEMTSEMVRRGSE